MAQQVQLQFILSKLSQWKMSLGSAASKKSTATCEFEYLQEQFLQRQRVVDALQTQREQQGITSKNATIPHEIRCGIKQLQTTRGKLQEELYRLKRKGKEPQQLIIKRQKIVENCTILLQDIQDRQKISSGGTVSAKVLTFTDQKARLLQQIVQTNDEINMGSDGAISQLDPQGAAAIQQWKKEEKKQDQILDNVIDGVIGLRKKVGDINNKQDQIADKTKSYKKMISKTAKRIAHDNDKLKQIIKDYRGSRCCMIVVLFLLLVGLIVVILKIFVF